MLGTHEKGPSLAERPFPQNNLNSRSEVELDRELDDAMALLGEDVPNLGVFTAPVAALKPSDRLFPLKDHNGWFRKL